MTHLDKPRSWRHLSGVLTLGMGLAVGTSVAASDTGGDPAQAGDLPRPVVSVIVGELDLSHRSFPGTIRAGTEAMLGFQLLGRLVARPVELGQRVKAGDVLAELDPEDSAANVRAAEAAVSAADVAATTAQKTYDRVRALNRRNVAPKAALEQAQQGLAAAEAARDKARADLARAKDAQNFTRLTAPVDGVVSMVFADVGTVVQAGAPVVQVSGDDSREGVIDLPAQVLADLPQDTKFEVWLENTPEVRVPAHIDRVEPLADAATRTRRVHLALDGDTSRFRLGALIRAGRAGGGQKALLFPKAALFDCADGAGQCVWVVHRQDGAARVVQTKVQTGAAFGEMIEARQGITPGAEVVTRGIHSLTNDQPVGGRVVL